MSSLAWLALTLLTVADAPDPAGGAAIRNPPVELAPTGLPRELEREIARRRQIARARRG